MIIPVHFVMVMSSSSSKPQLMVPSPKPFWPSSNSSKRRKFRGTAEKELYQNGKEVHRKKECPHQHNSKESPFFRLSNLEPERTYWEQLVRSSSSCARRDREAAQFPVANLCDAAAHGRSVHSGIHRAPAAGTGEAQWSGQFAVWRGFFSAKKLFERKAPTARMAYELTPKSAEETCGCCVKNEKIVARGMGENVRNRVNRISKRQVRLPITVRASVCWHESYSVHLFHFFGASRRKVKQKKVSIPVWWHQPSGPLLSRIQGSVIVRQDQDLWRLWRHVNVCQRWDNLLSTMGDQVTASLV